MSLDLPKKKPNQGSPSYAIYISERMVGPPLKETDLVFISSFEEEKRTIPSEIHKSESI